MAHKSLTMYWLPHCSTCKKAVTYLEKSGYVPNRFRDIKADPLDSTEVTRLSRLVGSAGDMFSRRARKYLEMNLSARTLSDDEMIHLMSVEYTFIKRPVLVSGGRAIAGFTTKSYDEFLKKV
jgi:arsenate reductase